MPKQARSAATRKALIHAAERLFAARGYLAVSVDEICRAANVSKGAFYHHFASKQAIFMALLQNWLQRLQATLESEHAAQPDFPTALLAMSRQLGQVWEEGRTTWPLLLDFWSQAVRDEEVWQVAVAPYRQFESLFTQWLREIAPKDTTPLTAARVLLAFTTGVLLEGLLLPNDTNWGEVATAGIQTLLRGWQASPQAGDSPTTTAPNLPEGDQP